jgi:hypothetical protein
MSGRAVDRMAGAKAPGGIGRVRHLAQANIARQRARLDAPVMSEFVAALDPVNRIAEHSPGFVWRLSSSESHGATVLSDGSSPIIVNLSVWESYDELHAFVYRSPHGAYLRRRARWFQPTRQPSTVLWWVEPDERPTVEEALRRLRYLQAHGPSAQAFTLRRRFEPDGRPTSRRGRGVVRVGARPRLGP